MKKTFTTLFLLLFLLTTITALGQDSPISKGAMLIGGSVSFASMSGDLYEDDGDKATQFQFSPTYYYFVTKGFACGAKFAYLSQSKGDWSSSILSIGPALGYFIDTGNEKIYPYLGVAYTFDSSKDEDSSEGGYEYKATGSHLIFGLGAAFMLSDHLAVIPEIAYNLVTLEPDETDAESYDGNIFMISIGLAGFLW
ncbi:MAG: outer membrane beta-barrel protein [candidate division Zixibacteria bacterium]|nr:outer membrane beta-barrel protein [Candidatus Tariuqbacter arcticus]